MLNFHLGPVVLKLERYSSTNVANLVRVLEVWQYPTPPKLGGIVDGPNGLQWRFLSRFTHVTHLSILHFPTWNCDYTPSDPIFTHFRRVQSPVVSSATFQDIRFLMHFLSVFPALNSVCFDSLAWRDQGLVAPEVVEPLTRPLTSLTLKWTGDTNPLAKNIEFHDLATHWLPHVDIKRLSLVNCRPSDASTVSAVLHAIRPGLHHLEVSFLGGAAVDQLWDPACE